MNPQDEQVRDRPVGNLAAEIGKQAEFESLRQEAYLNLVRTQEKLAAEFAKLFGQHGISDPQYNALRILRGEGAPMQVHQIGERMVAARTDISRLVDRLVAAGFVHRERSRKDRRVVLVSLTDKGHSILDKLEEPVRNLHERQFATLGEDDLKTLNRLLFEARH